MEGPMKAAVLSRKQKPSVLAEDHKQRANYAVSGDLLRSSAIYSHQPGLLETGIINKDYKMNH